MSFSKFLLNENKIYLNEKIGDILSALQELVEDADNMGKRQVISNSQEFINQIRKILHGRWDDEDKPSLKILQKVGVAIAKGIDSKEDMQAVLGSCVQELQKLINNNETPINDIGVES